MIKLKSHSSDVILVFPRLKYEPLPFRSHARHMLFCFRPKKINSSNKIRMMALAHYLLGIYQFFVASRSFACNKDDAKTHNNFITFHICRNCGLFTYRKMRKYSRCAFKEAGARREVCRAN